jgi:peroxiredoxin
MFLTFLSVDTNPIFAETVRSLAPDFTLNDIYGKRITLSEFRGNVVLLNFWATWCVPCRLEMPSLNNLYHEFKDKGLNILGISVDISEKPVRSFISEKRIIFPVLMDKDKEVYFDRYAALGLPVTFLIDRKGMIVERIIGEKDWGSPEMRGKILKLLE